MRAFDRQLNLVRIFAPETEAVPRLLLGRLAHEGFAGATVTRAYAGFSASDDRTAPLANTTSSPLVIEVVDPATFAASIPTIAGSQLSERLPRSLISVPWTLPDGRAAAGGKISR